MTTATIGEERSNTFIASPEKLDALFDFLGKQKGGEGLDTEFGRKVATTLVAHHGMDNIRKMASIDTPGLIKCIWLCINRYMLPDGIEAHLQMFDVRGVKQISFIPMIKGLLKEWKRTHPDCFLDSLCWSERRWKAWRKSIKAKGRNDTFPGADDTFECEDDEEAIAIMNELPGSKDYKLYFVQVIRRCMNGSNECASCYSVCYTMTELSERAKDTRIWRGELRSTDINEMYIKTALKLFIKGDTK